MGLKPPAAGWTPATLGSSLVGWWKADGTLYQDTGTTTPATADADPVGNWTDATGGTRKATQATAGLRPLLKLNIQNGKPVIRFDGTDDTLAFTTADIAAFTVAMCHSVASISNFSGPFNWSAAAQNGAAFPSDSATTWLPHLTVQGSGGTETANKKNNVAADTPPVAFKKYLWTSAPALRINGTDQTLAAGASGYSRTGAIAYNLGVGRFGGDIGEIVVANRILTAAEIASLESYLLSRWGV